MGEMREQNLTVRQFRSRPGQNTTEGQRQRQRAAVTSSDARRLMIRAAGPQGRRTTVAARRTESLLMRFQQSGSLQGKEPRLPRVGFWSVNRRDSGGERRQQEAKRKQFNRGTSGGVLK